MSDVSFIGSGDGRWVRDLQLKHCRFSQLDTVTIVQHELITERAKINGYLKWAPIQKLGDFKITNYAPA